MTDAPSLHAGGLRDYALVVKRHILLVLLCAGLTVALTIAFSLSQARVYQATVQVYLNNGNPAALASGATASSEAAFNPARVVANDASIASSPTVMNATAKKLGLTGSAAAAFRSSATVTADVDRDILVFSSEASTPAAARRYVDTYGRTFTIYQQNLQTAALRQAIRGTVAQMRLVRANRGTAADNALYDQLLSKEEQLRVLETLQTGEAIVLGPSASATLTQPQTKRNVLLGAVLGLLLGIGAAFLRDMFDTGVREAAEMEDILGVPLLGRLPRPPKAVSARSRLVMQDMAFGLEAEAFRMLRTNIEFGLARADDGSGSDGKVLVVASAVASEGKTTTAANLALTYARSGVRVALVDLDLRKPDIGRYFDESEGHVGVSDVIAGRAMLSQALTPIAYAGESVSDEDGLGGATASNGAAAAPDTGAQSNGNHHGDHAALPTMAMKACVVVAGSVPRDVGEVVAGPGVRELLTELTTMFDRVIVDTPPLLTFSDAAAIARAANGVLLVARVGSHNRSVLHEAKRALDSAGGIDVLGYVVTGDETVFDAGSYRYYVAHGRERSDRSTAGLK